MKKHDWWRINSHRDVSGDIYYCRNQGLVRARIKDGQWIWRKVHNARDALTVGFNIIEEEELKKYNGNRS